MIDTLRLTSQNALVYLLGVMHNLIQSNRRLLMLAQRSWAQPILQWSCRLKALAVYRRAAQSCPAYRAFLEGRGHQAINVWQDFQTIPVTDKANYVKPYSIESRCYGGTIPSEGVMIDESSGSSGQPSNWVRGREEQISVSRLLQNAYRQEYASEKQLIVLNCFSLGVWATGMNVTMSLADIAIVKSIGPDKQRLDNTLRHFGTGYRFLIAGYPPFLKNYADSSDLDLSDYDAHLVVGGEAMSEGMRSYLLGHFRSVRSSFGASDLEINIGAETEFTIALRRACAEDSELCLALFGRPTPPMIFQYNPADYYIETNEHDELLFTIARTANIAPKVRYNLRDTGGVMTIKQILAKLDAQGIDPNTIATIRSHAPLLYVYGRSDMTVAFYGCNISPADIDEVLGREPGWLDAFNSYRLRIEERGEALRPTLVITLEQSESAAPLEEDDATLAHRFLSRLKTLNPDFYEASRLFEPDQLVIERCAYATGPFANRDVRLKNHYI